MIKAIFWFYFSFKGRINRKQYWLFYFLPLLLSGLFFGAIGAFDAISKGDVMSIETVNPETMSLSSYILYIAITTIPSVWIWLSVSVKRLHDCSLSGKLLLWIILPSVLFPFVLLFPFSIFLMSILFIVSGIAFLILGAIKLFKPGTWGRNIYGDDAIDKNWHKIVAKKKIKKLKRNDYVDKNEAQSYTADETDMINIDMNPDMNKR